MTSLSLKLGDCVEVLASMEEASIDAIVSDPPYGLEFQGKDRDKLTGTVLHDPSEVGGFQDGSGGNPYSRSRIRYGCESDVMQQWHLRWLQEVHRVLKPRGVIKSFGGTRTFHRLAMAMEQAGFEDIDIEAWCYGSGFPKSMNIGKALDKMVGAEREVVGMQKPGGSAAIGDPYMAAEARAAGTDRPHLGSQGRTKEIPITAPSSGAAKTWDGWGTALKPAWESVLVGRKP